MPKNTAKLIVQPVHTQPTHHTTPYKIMFFHLLVCVNCCSSLIRINRTLTQVQGKFLGQITSIILYIKTSCVFAAVFQMGDHVTLEYGQIIARCQFEQTACLDILFHKLRVSEAL